MRPVLGQSIGALLVAGVIGVIVTGAPSAATHNGDSRGGAPMAPRLLSETGLYAKGGMLVVDPRNRLYSPQYPLWSDGAQKQRWVYLPPGAPIDVTNVDAWVFPVGTKFWKEFEFNGRRVETRLLWRAGEQGWVFASYKWNEEQTDAALAPADGDVGVAEITSNRRHTIPSVEECRACHDSKRTEILGFSALQLSTDRDANAIHGEPLTPEMVTLQTLMDDGVLRPRRSDLISHPPRIRADNPRARAVLGYLSTNCGMCHNSEGSLASLGMLLKQPSGPRLHGEASGEGGPNVALETTVRRASAWQIPGAGNDASARIAPGSPDLSALLYRMKSRRPSSQMPPLGTVVPDHDAIEAITRWIKEDLK
jgi:cytochrome c553